MSLIDIGFFLGLVGLIIPSASAKLAPEKAKKIMINNHNKSQKGF